MFSKRSTMVAPQDALPGRGHYIFHVPTEHETLGSSILGPWDDSIEVIYLAMGCFWGAEEIYWQVPGVVSTAVGYQGGFSPHPTYEEVCSGLTGHTESVLVAYDPHVVSTLDILRIFWERHDPTTGFRQGNDMGTQYRSAIFWTTDEQRDIAERSLAVYDEVLQGRGFDHITTTIEPAANHPFYYAEDHHQQYLYKVPHGYRCHALTGVAFPGLT